MQQDTCSWKVTKCVFNWRYFTDSQQKVDHIVLILVNNDHIIIFIWNFAAAASQLLTYLADTLTQLYFRDFVSPGEMHNKQINHENFVVSSNFEWPAFLSESPKLMQANPNWPFTMTYKKLTNCRLPKQIINETQIVAYCLGLKTMEYSGNWPEE